ncbi:MAG: dihydroorotate dehydrogenase-like protein [Phycisphaerales bacterium]
MDLTTNYMGLKLKNPILPGAGPMVDDLAMVRRLEDAGAPAIVMHSLFEEQIVGEQLANYTATELSKEYYAEALSYLPEPEGFHLGPDEYLDQIVKIKKAVSVPVIASLNGSTTGGWLDYAKLIAEAGADALELNVYDLATDAANGMRDAQTIELRTIDMVRLVSGAVKIPVAVKLSPFYTSMGHFAGQLAKSGAKGLVLFNRLYQPDIDVELLEMKRTNPVGLGDLNLRLRWLGILYGQTGASLAAGGGITTANEVVKAIMAGADVTQMVSALLLNGPEYLATVRKKFEQWMEEKEYASLSDLRGSMSMSKCPDPMAYQRANYMRTLMSWRM